MAKKKYKTTAKQLAELLHKFDPDLKVTKYSIERSRIDRDALAERIEDAIAEREKFPKSVAETIQRLAKQAVQEAPLWPSLVETEQQ